KPLRVKRPALVIPLQRAAGFFGHASRQVSCADLAPYLTVRMPAVLRDHVAEMINRFLQPALLAGNASDLVMRVGFVGVDLDRAFEARNCFGVLPALLVQQTELVMR